MAGFRRVALLIGVMAIATIVQAAPEDVAEAAPAVKAEATAAIAPSAVDEDRNKRQMDSHQYFYEMGLRNGFRAMSQGRGFTWMVCDCCGDFDQQNYCCYNFNCPNFRRGRDFTGMVCDCCGSPNQQIYCCNNSNCGRK